MSRPDWIESTKERARSIPEPFESCPDSFESSRSHARLLREHVVSTAQQVELLRERVQPLAEPVESFAEPKGSFAAHVRPLATLVEVVEAVNRLLAGRKRQVGELHGVVFDDVGALLRPVTAQAHALPAPHEDDAPHHCPAPLPTPSSLARLVRRSVEAHLPHASPPTRRRWRSS